MIERERTAFHEAGHAALVHAWGGRITLLTILENERALGRILWRRPAAMPRYPRLLVILAGPVAEAMAAGEGLDRGGVDHVDARALLLDRDDVEAALRRIEVIVGYSLKNQWPAVEALAAALWAEETIEGGRAHSLLW